MSARRTRLSVPSTDSASGSRPIEPGFLSRFGKRTPDSHETDMSVRAAWLQFVGGHSQSEISDMLGVSRVKVNRLIAEAQRDGRVKVFIDGSADSCIRLERELQDTFGLDGCDVAPNVSTMDPPLNVLGPAGARRLLRLTADPDVRLVGVGTGRTLSAVAQSLPLIARQDLDFVSVLGNLRRSGEIDVHDVVHQLASKVTGRCFTLPLPFVVESGEVLETLLAQAFLQPVLERVASANVSLLGVGSVEPIAHLVEIGMLTADELAGIAALGAVAEVAGKFFDAEGVQVHTELDDRFVAPALDDLKRGHTIIVAGSGYKVAALRAVLLAGVCNHLVVDEWTAEQVLRCRVR